MTTRVAKYAKYRNEIASNRLVDTHLISKEIRIKNFYSDINSIDDKILKNLKDPKINFAPVIIETKPGLFSELSYFEDFLNNLDLTQLNELNDKINQNYQLRKNTIFTKKGRIRDDWLAQNETYSKLLNNDQQIKTLTKGINQFASSGHSSMQKINELIDQKDKLPVVQLEPFGPKQGNLGNIKNYSKISLVLTILFFIIMVLLVTYIVVELVIM